MYWAICDFLYFVYKKNHQVLGWYNCTSGPALFPGDPIIHDVGSLALNLEKTGIEIGLVAIAISKDGMGPFVARWHTFIF